MTNTIRAMMLSIPGLYYRHRMDAWTLVKVLGLLVAVNLAVYGAAALIARVANRRAFPRMDDRELDVLGCLWQMPRAPRESYRRYRRRLADHVRGYPAD